MSKRKATRSTRSTRTTRAAARTTQTTRIARTTRANHTAHSTPTASTASATARRAAIAVGLLVGFYVVALGAIVLLVGGTLFVFGTVVGNVDNTTLHPTLVKLALIPLIAAGAIVIGLLKALRRERFQPYGIQLSEVDQPLLWEMVRDLAQRVVTRPPDEVWLVPEVNAAVTEDARLLGLRGGKRYLLLGLPLLQAMNVDQLRAVVAHELGHYSHAHTRLSEINYRGRTTIIRTIAQLNNGGVLQRIVRWCFTQYAKLYFLVESAVSRSQEFEADQAAGAIAGRRAIQSALLELPVLTAAWNFYLRQYVGIGLRHGHTPQAAFLSFSKFLAARTGELDRLRGEGPDDQTSRWDSHPAIADRVAALQNAPEQGETHDPRRAFDLLVSPEHVVPALEATSLDSGDRAPSPWPEYMARSLYSAERELADAFYRALSRITGRTPESLETIFAFVEQGKLEELAVRLAEVNAPTEGGLTAALRVALLDCGALQVQHRWDAPAQLVRPDGSPVDLKEVFFALEQGPAGAAKVRNLLWSWGLDPRTAVARQTTAVTADHAAVIAAVSPVKLDKMLWDLFVTNDGLIFVPITGALKRRDPIRRLKKLSEESTAAELAADDQHTWIAYEDIASATVHRPTPLKASLTTYDGSELDITAPFDAKGLGDSVKVLEKVLGELADRKHVTRQPVLLTR